MKASPTALLLAAIAGHSLAHPVQNTKDDANNGLARRDEAAPTEESIDWNDPANYRDVDWSTVNYDSGNGLPISAEAPKVKMQDWNDPANYDGVDWDAIDYDNNAGSPAEASKVKRQYWNDPESYEDVGWSAPKLHETRFWNPLLEDDDEGSWKPLKRDAAPASAENSLKMAVSSSVEATSAPTSTTSTSAEDASDYKSNGKSSSQGPPHSSITGECARLGPIFKATIDIGRSCKDRCNQYVFRVKHLVTKMDGYDCDIDHYATKPYLPFQEEEVKSRVSLQTRGTMDCNMLNEKLQSQQALYESGNCGSECAALGEEIQDIIRYMQHLNCRASLTPAKPIPTGTLQARDASACNTLVPWLESSHGGNRNCASKCSALSTSITTTVNEIIQSDCPMEEDPHPVPRRDTEEDQARENPHCQVLSLQLKELQHDKEMYNCTDLEQPQSMQRRDTTLDDMAADAANVLEARDHEWSLGSLEEEVYESQGSLFPWLEKDAEQGVWKRQDQAKGGAIMQGIESESGIHGS